MLRVRDRMGRMLRRFRNFLLVEESSADGAADWDLDWVIGVAVAVAVAVAGAAAAAALLRSEGLEKGPIYACWVWSRTGRDLV